MLKKGFTKNWQNRHWISAGSGYNAAISDPDIPNSIKGPNPEYLVLEIRGRGYALDSDNDRYQSEIIYVSSPIKAASGIFRFIVQYKRNSPSATKTAIYFGITNCNTNGVFNDAASSTTYAKMDSDIASSNTRYNALLLYSNSDSGYMWSKVTTEVPSIEQSTYTMMGGAQAAEIYRKVSKGNRIATTACVQWYNSGYTWTTNPLYWQDLNTAAATIISRAKSLSGYKYWFGGAGQVANKALADSLRASYPSVWTSEYYVKALKDIDGNNRVADCSYLVNYAYGWASPGSHGAGTSTMKSAHSLGTWTGTPKAGMIAWRSGHCAIVLEDGTDPMVAEMSGIDYDYQEKRMSERNNKFTAVFYLPSIAY